MAISLASSTALDEDLATAVAAGDQAASEELDRRFRARLLAFAGRAGVRSATDAEDIVQNTLASAFLQLQDGKFRFDCKVSTWLYQILRGQLAEDARRQRRRAVVISLEEIDCLRVASLSSEDVELKLTLEQALDSLTAERRLVFLMSAREGFSKEEIASIIGRPAGTVRRWFHEGRRQFRELLSAHVSEQAPSLPPGVE